MKYIIMTPLRETTAMSTLSDELSHLKNHVKYPASKQQVVATCNNMSDVPVADKDWFSKNLSDGNYRGADEVVSALLKKV